MEDFWTDRVFAAFCGAQKADTRFGLIGLRSLSIVKPGHYRKFSLGPSFLFSQRTKLMTMTEQQNNVPTGTPSLEKLTALAEDFIDTFGVAVDADEPISGADAVDWIADRLNAFREALGSFALSRQESVT